MNVGLPKRPGRAAAKQEQRIAGKDAALPYVLPAIALLVLFNL